MSSLVLARKWRPHSFDTVAGQKHVVQTLTHALTTQRLHHAYLFTGTRGVGKTSIARIFAKALSCETGITPTPCGVCINCKEIDAGNFVDLIEIDAASRSKVEDTREILDNVLYPPTRGRFKVYLIDEIHMLSGHSFNALLKTLEEPPEHVKFLLATTDPKKLPITVLSRCLQFHLKNMLPHEIIEHLTDILGKEKITFEATALPWIAQAADGSLRDALSLLDQAIAHGLNEVKEENVRAMLGYVETQAVTSIVKSLIARNHEALLNISKDMQHQGADCVYLLRELQNFFHQMVIAQCVPEYKSDSSFMTIATELAHQISPEDLQLFYQIALKGKQDLGLAPSPWVAFEMTLLRMLCFQAVDVTPLPPSGHLPPQGGKGKSMESGQLPPQEEKEKELKSEQLSTHVEKEKSAECLSPWERMPRQGQERGNPSTSPLAGEVSAQSSSSSPSPLVGEVSAEQTEGGIPQWESIIPHLNLSGMAKNIAQHCMIEDISSNVSDNNIQNITLKVPAQQKTFFTAGIKQQLETNISDYFLKNLQKTISLHFHFAEETLNSPAVKQEQKKQETFNQAQTSLNNDETFQKILNTFHGTIIPESIKNN